MQSRRKPYRPAGSRVYVEQPFPEGALVYWTDGSCEPNPGDGGCAAVLDGQVVYTGHEIYPTTNIRMEGLAIIGALEHSDRRPAVLMTDSQFWVDVLTKWAAGWERRGWRKADKKPPENLDLVQQAYELYSTHPCVEIRWVRGHAGHEWNEMADEAANSARMMAVEASGAVRERPF